jgi:hypothetical protein
MSVRPRVLTRVPDPMNFMADLLLLVVRVASAYGRPSVATNFQAFFTSIYFRHIGAAAL